MLPEVLFRSLHLKTGMRCLSIMKLFVHKVTVKRSSMALKTLSSTSFNLCNYLKHACHHIWLNFSLLEFWRDLLHAFEKESNKKPQQLIFYRFLSFICSVMHSFDHHPMKIYENNSRLLFSLCYFVLYLVARNGISNGQFKQVVEKEIPAIEKVNWFESK
jgi:hypothetical protein